MDINHHDNDTEPNSVASAKPKSSASHTRSGSNGTVKPISIMRETCPQLARPSPDRASSSTLKMSLAGQMAGVGGGGGFECWGGRRRCRFVGGGKALDLLCLARFSCGNA